MIATTARDVIENLVTIGFSLDHCSVPGRTSEEFLGPNEIEALCGAFYAVIQHARGVGSGGPIHRPEVRPDCSPGYVHSNDAKARELGGPTDVIR